MTQDGENYAQRNTIPASCFPEMSAVVFQCWVRLCVFGVLGSMHAFLSVSCFCLGTAATSQLQLRVTDCIFVCLAF